MNNGAEITQDLNSDPGVIVGDQKVEDVDYDGTFFINTPVDDDYVGVIFSYVDNSNFYLVSWKRRDQTWYGNVSHLHHKKIITKLICYSEHVCMYKFDHNVSK